MARRAFSNAAFQAASCAVSCTDEQRLKPDHRHAGEALRSAYQDIMREQAGKQDANWFKEQLGGADVHKSVSDSVCASSMLQPGAQAAESRMEVAAHLSRSLAIVEQGRAVEKTLPADPICTILSVHGRQHFAYSQKKTLFLGRLKQCDMQLSYRSDQSVSRVSAIVYLQPEHGLVLICDPGNMTGIRVARRQFAEFGKPRSRPDARTMIALVWGEHASLVICGQQVEFFPPPREDPNDSDEMSEVSSDDEEIERLAAIADAKRLPTAANASALCKLCMCRPRSAHFAPCGHQVCCLTCALAVLQSDIKCFQCNSSITSIDNARGNA